MRLHAHVFVITITNENIIMTCSYCLHINPHAYAAYNNYNLVHKKKYRDKSMSCQRLFIHHFFSYCLM